MGSGVFAERWPTTKDIAVVTGEVGQKRALSKTRYANEMAVLRDWPSQVRGRKGIIYNLSGSFDKQTQTTYSLYVIYSSSRVTLNGVLLIVHIKVF